jgi:hypothetical protein
MHADDFMMMNLAALAAPFQPYGSLITATEITAYYTLFRVTFAGDKKGAQSKHWYCWDFEKNSFEVYFSFQVSILLLSFDAPSRFQLR